MAKSVRTLIRDVQTARAVIAHEAVDCFVGTEGEESRQPAKLVSCTGGAFFGRKGESWPVAADGVPLIPWLQVVCTEMKRLYGAFYNKQAVCFFLREDFSAAEALSVPDRGEFVVRDYALSERLVPLNRPASLARHPFHRVAWQRAVDYPSLSKYHDLFDPTVYRALCDEGDFAFANHPGMKIGGWPTPVQRPQAYPGSCDLQIDMTKNYTYGDSGVAYLSRSGGTWRVEFECC
jgi:hypothetical protein